MKNGSEEGPKSCRIANMEWEEGTNGCMFVERGCTIKLEDSSGQGVDGERYENSPPTWGAKTLDWLQDGQSFGR